MIIRVDTIGDGYPVVARKVLHGGDEVSPRGKKTRELLDVVIVADTPLDAAPTGWGRQLNPAIGIAEAMQLIGGVTHPELMVNISSNFADFIEDDGQFHGAYGPRLRRNEQVLNVIQKLNNDRDSRQAVMTLWDPSLDNAKNKRDFPCTISLVFMIRRNRLNLHVTMRSNDVWWGLTYDAFQFTQLQLAVAGVLGIVPGEYRHHAISLHAYERDWSKIDVLAQERDTEARRVLGGLCPSGWYKAQARARGILLGMPPVEANDVETWMANTMAGYQP